MKQRYLVIHFVLLACVLQNCTEEEKFSPEKVQFSFNLQTPEISGGRTNSFDLPEGTSLRLSLERSNGETVFTNQSIELLKMNDHYMTEPIDLAPGRYVIVDFMLIDESSEILYATPKRGSPLANTVAHALPYAFGVSKNKLTHVEMQVVDASQKSPEDFGYVSFNIDLVGVFELSVFKPENGQIEFTDADGFILQGGDTLEHLNLEAEINQITLNPVGEEPFTLVVIKDGYARHTKEFSFDDLQEELNGRALEIVLEPAFTIRMQRAQHWDNPFELIFNGAGGGHVSVDWGDGGQDSFVMEGYEKANHVGHMFPDDRKYFVSFTGDLNKLWDVVVASPALISDINLNHLSALKRLDLGYERDLPKIIDLSYNTQIESVQAISKPLLEQLILPADNKIRSIQLDASTGLATTALDDIIDKVHNSVTKNPRSGTFGLRYSPYDEEADEMIGPPSANGLEKLQDLVDNYGWGIAPDPH